MNASPAPATALRAFASAFIPLSSLLGSRTDSRRSNGDSALKLTRESAASAANEGPNSTTQEGGCWFAYDEP